MFVFFDQGQEFRQSFFQITGQVQRNRNVLVQFGRVNIHMDNGFGTCVTISVTGYPITQTATCYDKHVSIGNSKVTINVTMHTGQTNCTFIAARIYTQAHQSAYYRQIRFMCQFNQFCFNSTGNSTATNHQHRSFCSIQSSGSFFYIPLIGLNYFWQFYFF